MTDSVPCPAREGPLRRRFGRRKFDRQPEHSASVLIASNGLKVPGVAIQRAIGLRGNDAVAVVSIARLYGSALGLQNPGLMPSRKEMEEQRQVVTRAVREVEDGGAEAWGQIAISRRPAKTIAAAAVARGVAHVIIVRPEQPVRWRRVVEGDLVQEVARKLGPEVEVEGISP